MPSRGFTVDTQNRSDVVAFWHAIYQASEGYEDRINWTGNYSSNAGTTSITFVRDVERRINFYRAMVGVSADIEINTNDTVNIFASDVSPNIPSSTTKKTEASQAAAYMVARARMANQAINHNPPPSTPAWSPTAWNGAARGNFTYGYFGPGAMDAYMREFEESNAATTFWNAVVGHRRWMLYSRATNFATGDIPGEFIYPNTIRYSANSLYVVPKNSELASPAQQFIAYPPAGYFPARLNSPFWSLGYPGGNFYNAQVEMRDSDGNLVPTNIITQTSTDMGRGDPSVVWNILAPEATATSVGADRTFYIRVTGITGSGVPSEFEYSVTLINPDIQNDELIVTGSSSPPTSKSANYLVSWPVSTEAVQVNTFTKSFSQWNEGAEYNNLPDTIIDHTWGSYPLITSPIQSYGSISGSKTFRLTHPVSYDSMTNGVPEEIFEINREVLTKPSMNSTFNFKYKMGYMLSASSLAIECTQDDGATWQAIGSRIDGIGTSSMTLPNTIVQWSATIPPSESPYRFRFRYFKNDPTGSTFNHQNPSHTALPTGIFIDDITTTNCTWFDLKKINDVPTPLTYFTLNAEAVGIIGVIPNGSTYYLRQRIKLGNHWFPYGSAKEVVTTDTPITGFDGWLAYEYPGLTGGFSGSHAGDGIPNGIKFGFMLNPLLKSASRDQISFYTSPARSGEESYVSITRAANGIRDEVSAEWSDTLEADSWSSEGVIINYSNEDQTAMATAPAGTGKRFLRWKVTAP